VVAVVDRPPAMRVVAVYAIALLAGWSVVLGLAVGIAWLVDMLVDMI
jgi:hypothetical protein